MGLPTLMRRGAKTSPTGSASSPAPSHGASIRASGDPGPPASSISTDFSCGLAVVSRTRHEDLARLIRQQGSALEFVARDLEREKERERKKKQKEKKKEAAQAEREQEVPAPPTLGRRGQTRAHKRASRGPNRPTFSASSTSPARTRSTAARTRGTRVGRPTATCTRRGRTARLRASSRVRTPTRAAGAGATAATRPPASPWSAATPRSRST